MDALIGGFISRKDVSLRPSSVRKENTLPSLLSRLGIKPNQTRCRTTAMPVLPGLQSVGQACLL